jgi:hypothetical protein
MNINSPRSISTQTEIFPQHYGWNRTHLHNLSPQSRRYFEVFEVKVFQTPLIMMRDVLTDRNGWRDPSNGWLPSSSISRLFPNFAPASLPPTFGSIPTASINGDLKKPCHCLAST